MDLHSGHNLHTTQSPLNLTTVHDHAAMLRDRAAAKSMSHSMHHSMSHSMGDYEMKMYFHGGTNEQILFDFWMTESLGLFLLSCLALFILAFSYEGLKLLRDKMIRSELTSRKRDQLLCSAKNTPHICHCSPKKAQNTTLNEDNQPLNGKDCCGKVAGQNGNSSNDAEANQIVFASNYGWNLLSRRHLIQTFLHMLQLAVSYMLMLVFMTYNTWLCLAVVLGAGAGYFLFGLQRLTSIDVNEHCH